ncbi:MAG: glycosyltransferase family 2 protein [Nitrospiraceae bacterium]|nr:MAG: glycosyltransferase family 2 protein [Nitrospiraceae bacterium]
MNYPPVSVIIPCRNEEKFIEGCLDSIAASDYPKDNLEVLVIDGMSGDATRDIIRRCIQRSPFIKLLDNPKRITPCALNTGIRHAKGEIIVRMDAHARYERDYISKCVRYLNEYDADNVGGTMITLPRDNTVVGKAIVTALSHRFGVGNSAFRTGAKGPKWVDTVFGGCYRREIFERIGLFNEELVCSQDMEFNKRLKREGGRILLVPEIISYYHARSDFKSFVRHNFRNGVWAIVPFIYTDAMPVSLRHIIPVFFVAGLFGSAALSFYSMPFLWLFYMIGVPYFLANLYFSGAIAVERLDFRYALLMPVVFASLHIPYGLGSVKGLLRTMVSRRFWRNRFSGK